jgi:hypothetical protein
MMALYLEKMKTIYFKNGATAQISVEIAKVLRQRIMDGCGNFQIFTDENDDPFLFVNVSEIVLVK